MGFLLFGFSLRFPRLSLSSLCVLLVLFQLLVSHPPGQHRLGDAPHSSGKMVRLDLIAHIFRIRDSGHVQGWNRRVCFDLCGRPLQVPGFETNAGLNTIICVSYICLCLQICVSINMYFKTYVQICTYFECILMYSTCFKVWESQIS